MKNYESPTIEQAGGAGNEIEPNIDIPVTITDALLAVEFYLAAVAFTNAAMAILPILTTVAFKTANFNN